jgi:hypothetical protein
MFFRISAMGCVLFIVAGCADTTDNSAVSAFASAATAGSQAFTTAQSAESQAFAQAALNAALGNGKITTDNCWNANYTAAKCQLVISVDGQTVTPQAIAENGAKLAAALSTYGQGLEQLATAKDITDEESAEQKLATGLGQIASLAGVPGVAAVGGLIATIKQDVALADRRLQLLAIAQQADPAVQVAADTLQSETELLQQNVILSASAAVQHEEVLLATQPAGEKLAIAQALSAAVTAEQKAGALKVNIATQLKAAHTAMIQALQNPKADPQAALSEISALAQGFSSVETAFNPASAASTNAKGK